MLRLGLRERIRKENLELDKEGKESSSLGYKLSHVCKLMKVSCFLLLSFVIVRI